MFNKVIFSAIVLTSLVSTAKPNYPMGPDPQLTPGHLCTTPNSRRYPEGIAYCERNVSPALKREIIETYDKSLGYQIERMDRRSFKIDHYIPLCAGGSNDRDNLWPQNEKVYNITDPLEPIICEKMAEGKLSQVKAVEIIRYAKNHLSEVPEIIEQVNAL